MISTPLLLLLAAASYVHSEELTQPAYMTLQPDQRLSINCKVSYSVTSYETAWIRQLAGKGLEWIGHIGIGGGTVYSDKLKNKFSISRDTSSNTITLQGQNLQTEDTAVYYCARDGLGGVASYVFDYWGKGTMVTVSSGGRSAPTSIFAMSQCGSGSDGFLTLGCLTSGFSPADSLKFKWKDPSGNDLTDFIQYPAIGNNGAYTSVSHVRVKTADWSTEKAFTCTVEHPAGSKTETLKKEVQDTELTVKINGPDIKEMFINNMVVLECVVTGKTEQEVKEATILWTVANISTTTHVMEKLGQNTKSSILTVDWEDWFSGKQVKCSTNHVSESISIRKGAQDLNINIYEPSNANGPQKVSLLCEINSSDLGDVYVMWAKDWKTYIDGKTTSPIRKEDKSTSVFSILTVTAQDFNNPSVVFTCTVKHAGMKKESGPLMASTSKSKSKCECPVW